MGIYPASLDISPEIQMTANSICPLVFAAALAVLPFQAQNGAEPPDDTYNRCITAINSNLLDACDPCREYISRAPAFEASRVTRVKQWVAAYEKVLPYVHFLQGLASDPNVPWVVYQPDENIDLPETSEVAGPFGISISRSFTDSNEGEMLRKAEAVYPGPNKMIAGILRPLRVGEANVPEEMTPIWGWRGNDDLEMTDVVTASAVRYYYDLSQTERRDPRLPTGFTALASAMRYKAVISHSDQYSHGDETFQNVYVADMTLEWRFQCGGLCGVGFTRNKVVVLDARSDVLAMYLDAPVTFVN